MRVLLVDDEPMNLRIGERMLERLGCTTLAAGDAESAIELVRSYRFDAVLMDVELPGMDGFEALPILRNADAAAHPSRTGRLRILAVSAGRPGVRREDYLSAGFDDLVEKPVLLDQLRAALDFASEHEKRRVT